MISVVGGVYGERCRYPAWDQIYGSGLRAAMAASSVSSLVKLHANVSHDWLGDVEATLSSFGIEAHLKPSPHSLTFAYLHGFAPDELPEKPAEGLPELVVDDEVVLRFGMLEGDAQVKGDRVVYDPQSENADFHANGSSARTLAMLLTGRELVSLHRADASRPATHMPEEEDLLRAIVALQDLPRPPHLVLVKDGFGGLTVFQGDQPVEIPSYGAESFFRIGSGDVTAAAFAHAWGELRLDPLEAADYAARCTAFFVDGPRLPLPSVADISHLTRNKVQRDEVRIVGIGDFELQNLVRSTEYLLRYLGGKVNHTTFGLDDVTSVHAGVDLLLIGSRCREYELDAAAAAGLNPTVIFWPSAYASAVVDRFPNAIVARDYATALYHIMRSPDR